MHQEDSPSLLSNSCIRLNQYFYEYFVHEVSDYLSQKLIDLQKMDFSKEKFAGDKGKIFFPSQINKHKEMPTKTSTQIVRKLITSQQSRLYRAKIIKREERVKENKSIVILS